MSNANLNTKNQFANSATEGTVEVLYQKMGDRWFAFSLVGEDVFVGSLTEEEIARGNATDTRSDSVHRISGNS